jgi:hypothetical protein
MCPRDPDIVVLLHLLIKQGFYFDLYGCLLKRSERETYKT